MTKGPAPKPFQKRQRRNKATTRATLQEAPGRLVQSPKLPAHLEWHAMTRAWWKDIWASPMAAEFVKADWHGLFRLAVLVDRFWLEPSVSIAAEIRHQQAAFGLTPLDRRRLEWEVERAESASRKKPAVRRQTGDDPRSRLYAV